MPTLGSLSSTLQGGVGRYVFVQVQPGEVMYEICAWTCHLQLAGLPAATTDAVRQIPRMLALLASITLAIANVLEHLATVYSSPCQLPHATPPLIRLSIAASAEKSPPET